MANEAPAAKFSSDAIAARLKVDTLSLSERWRIVLKILFIEAEHSVLNGSAQSPLLQYLLRSCGHPCRMSQAYLSSSVRCVSRHVFLLVLVFSAVAVVQRLSFALLC